MVRGYQKKVIHLKNTGSALFDEAYFIVNDKEEKGLGSQDMITEANRIIKENMTGKSEGGKFLRFLKKNFIPFFAGVIFAALVFIPILIF